MAQIPSDRLVTIYGGSGFVGRLPSDGYVSDRDVKTLTANRVWNAPTSRAA